MRRFCLLAIEEEVPDEATVRKLTGRLGAERVAERSRLVSARARRERRLRARAVGIDSTLVEADVRSPTAAALAADGVRTLARERKRLAAKLDGAQVRGRERARARQAAAGERADAAAPERGRRSRSCSP